MTHPKRTKYTRSFNVMLDEETKQRMDQHPEVNWSGLIRVAIGQHIDLIRQNYRRNPEDHS